MMKIAKCGDKILHKYFMLYITSSPLVFLNTNAYTVFNFILQKILLHYVTCMTVLNLFSNCTLYTIIFSYCKSVFYPKSVF